MGFRTDSAQTSEVVSAWKGMYDAVSEFLAQHSTSMGREISQRSRTPGNRVLSVTLVVLVLLWVLDRYVIQRMFRMRS